MLCCVGLAGGFAVGQYLGGPWLIVSPAIGFGLGLLGDVKLMKCCWKSDKCHKEGKVKKSPKLE